MHKRLLFLAVSLFQALNADPLPMPFRVTLLGTIGGARIDAERYGASLLVEAGGERLLFDCGRGTPLRLVQAGHPPALIDKVFVTHLHSDHIMSLPDVWLAPLGSVALDRPLLVWGPEGTAAMAANLERAYEANTRYRRASYELLPGPIPPDPVIQAKDIEEGVVYESNGVKVTAFFVDHGWVKPALGYRIDYAGHSVLYSGDTRFSENLISNAAGLDILIHEVYLYADPANCTRVPGCDYHSTPEQAAEVFLRTQPKLAVYTHIVWLDGTPEGLLFRTKRIYDGPVQIGADLMVIDISSDEVKVLPKP